MKFSAQVWLADDNLLVLKGGSTLDRSGFDDPWKPLDDFQAPYREPVLPPPDFDPDSLEIGVGVDIDVLLAERALEKTRKEKEAREHLRHQQPIIPDIPAFVDPDNALKPFRDEVVQTHEREFKTFFNDVSQFISDMENFHSARKASARQEVDEPFFKEVPPTTVLEATTPPPAPRAREGKHRKSKIELERGKLVPVELPPPSLLPPTRDETTPAPRLAPFTSFPRNIAPPPVSKENLPAPPTILREVHHSSSIEVLPKSFRETPPPTTTTTTSRPLIKEITPAWQQRQKQTTEVTKKSVRTLPTTTPYPLSYSSPHSKVFLSTKYVTHGPSSTPPPSISPSSPRPHQARSPVRHNQSPRPSSEQSRGFTFKPVLAPSSPPPPPAPVRIFRPRSTTTTSPPRRPLTTVTRRIVPSTTSRPVRRQGSSGPRTHYHDPGLQEEWRPVTTTPPSPPFPGKFNPAPTPYSLFQSVPENIGETDVFHLSQNVDFGKKIESGGRGLLTNEVDTGFRRHSPPTPFSPAKQHVATRGPRLISPKARQPAPAGGGARGGGGFRPSFGALPPAKQKAHHPVNARGRSSLRRRRPKAVTARQQSVDRSGTGDVRYVSFYSGGAGGNAWGYSYNLG